MEHINTDPMGQNQKHLEKTQKCIFMRVLTEPSHRGQTSENMFFCEKQQRYTEDIDTLSKHFLSFWKPMWQRDTECEATDL